MKITLSVLLCSILITLILFSCSSSKNTKGQQGSNISIDITGVEDFKSFSDCEVLFNIKNNTKELIIIPAPLPMRNAGYTRFPEFFTPRFEGLSCDQPIDIPERRAKELDRFTQIEPNKSATFKINPERFKDIFCFEEIAETKTVQIIYMPEISSKSDSNIDKYYSDPIEKEAFLKILNFVPLDTIYSNKFVLIE